MSISPMVIAGDKLSSACRSRLSELGFEVRIIPSYDKLDVPVSSHADLLIFSIDNKIFTFGGYADRITDILSELETMGYETETVTESPAPKYPNDVLLNCLVLGKHIFSKTDSTAKKIKSYAEAKEYRLTSVKQGYTRCTACPISEKAIISADSSILSTAHKLGLDTLRISNGGVRLDGYDYGFIGGACGVFEDKIFFAGDLRLHPDGEEIADFCRAYGKEPVSLSNEPLYDIGSIFFFGNRAIK